MKPAIALGLLAYLTLVPAAAAQTPSELPAAKTPAAERAPHPNMREDKDGVLEKDEYEVISPNGSVTRSWCPYTCEARGLPKEHCRTWGSLADKTRCYVQDTRLPNNAVPLQ